MNGRAVITERFRPMLILGGVLILITASVVIGLYNERMEDSRALAAAEVQGRILADTVTAALSFGDRPALREYVNAMRADPNLDAVGVYDDSGRLVAGFTRSRLARRLADTLNATTAPGRIIIKTPVVQSGVRLGTVYLRERAEPLAQRLGRYAPAGLPGPDGPDDGPGDVPGRPDPAPNQSGPRNSDRRARTGRSRPAPEPEDGSHRPPDRRHRSRLQQHAGDRDRQPRPAYPALRRRRSEAVALRA